ncbi:hypothetical protein [Nocardiopsis metallicus]|uniref:Uncharacterized protein n=1 Tax=Nocardiopsis metallicus TaxID=179819 RepID=A0A840WC23_9ACTN|nr:hypothetical protein [Nocardiopsis metallicus]MBB5494580.1 hypothetical protein [Nocardiopsis metallicus]
MSQPPPPQPPQGPQHLSGPQRFPSGPHRPPYGPAVPPESLSTGAKIALGGAAAGTLLLVLILIGYFAWVRPGGTSGAAEPPPSPSGAVEPEGDEEPQDGPRDPEDRPGDGDGGEAGPQDPGAPPEFAEFEVQEFSGSGRTTVDIETSEEPRLLSISNKGAGGISVWSVDSEAETQWEVIRRGGGYEGRLLLTPPSMIDDYDALLVHADGDWEISLQPLSAADRWEATETEYGGSGDDVVQLLWSPNNFSRLDVTHTGSSNFSLRSYDDTGTSSLVNEIGDYEGQITLTPRTVLIEVQSQGTWTITR